MTEVESIVETSNCRLTSGESVAATRVRTVKTDLGADRDRDGEQRGSSREPMATSSDASFVMTEQSAEARMEDDLFARFKRIVNLAPRLAVASASW